tara:strand:+ start:2740 stop:2919 length:180 start_codon:yes stop_codon:yes gene_type:complete
MMDEVKARFAEYARREKEIRDARIRELPWNERWMFLTIGDIVGFFAQSYRRLYRWLRMM